MVRPCQDGHLPPVHGKDACRMSTMHVSCVLHTVVLSTDSVRRVQVNNLLMRVVQISESHGVRFPREFGLLLKQVRQKIQPSAAFAFAGCDALLHELARSATKATGQT